MAAALLTGLLTLQAQEPGPKQGGESAAPPPAPAKPTYVGSEVCAACHEDIAKAFKLNPHQAVEGDKKRGFEGKACESCHGPGSVHGESASAADIRNPAKLPLADLTGACLGCHRNQPAKSGMIRNAHAAGQVGCPTCHSVHGVKSEALVRRKLSKVNELCSSCHLSVRAEFQKPYRHRVPEGAMACIDCHNPHGEPLFRNSRMAPASNEPGCLRCHGNKRGPFPFEHAPVRMEGCNGCHAPHGSANPKMLVRHEERLLCLECHSNVGTKPQTIGTVPPAFHDQRSPRFRNCSVCHVKIHGSYVDRTFQR
ncbi:MAG: DmsE family decaheme c-type cytochrome [Bryobacteraceae bacterium]